MLTSFLRILIYSLCIHLVSSVTYSPVVHASRFENAQKVRLVWEAVPDAVIYELVVTHGPGEQEKDKELNPPPVVYTSTQIYTAGVELDVAPFRPLLGSLWWQVRALDVNYQPISLFSIPENMGTGEFDPPTPLPTAYLDKKLIAPLFPTYAWIPVLNAASYEVQILSAKPDKQDVSGILVKSYNIQGALAFDCYDENAYAENGTWWWRVIALDAAGLPIGDWSPAQSFTVKRDGYLVAAFGDSVTHGGGAISNPPCDPAYDWTSQVGFPVRNLGRSGDTVEKMAARFDAHVVPFSPGVLLIMGGINDIRGGKSAAEVISHLEVIKQKCKVNSIIPVFMTLTPVNPAYIMRAFGEVTAPDWQQEWQQVNDWIRNQPHYVDIAPLLTDKEGLMPESLAADGLHPDTKGKEMIGQAVGAFFLKQVK